MAANVMAKEYQHQQRLGGGGNSSSTVTIDKCMHVIYQRAARHHPKLTPRGVRKSFYTKTTDQKTNTTTKKDREKAKHAEKHTDCLAAIPM